MPGQEVLDSLMTLMLAESEFSPTGYRPGEIRDRHLVSMLKSFLLVSVKDACGAARFANGVWRELPLALPLIERLMQAAGWSEVVMNQFLTLVERAGAYLPIEIFGRTVTESMDSEGFRLERWNDAGIPARVLRRLKRSSRTGGLLRPLSLADQGQARMCLCTRRDTYRCLCRVAQ
jgi:hypothetical protein